MMNLGLLIFLPFIFVGCGVENGDVEAPDQSTGESPPEDEPGPDDNDIPNEVDTPEFVEVETEETVVSPDTQQLSFTVTNHHEELEVFGGEYYTLEYHSSDTWEDITPVDFFEDIGYSIMPEESHEFTHTLLREDQDELEPVQYRIRKEFMLLDGTENIPAEDADQFEIAVEFEVEE